MISSIKEVLDETTALEFIVETHRSVKTGQLLVVKHRYNGMYHRDPSEGPAIIYYTPNKDNEIDTVIYCWRGRRHRKDGPAMIEYVDTVEGKRIAMLEMYYRHGKLHRDFKDGPAWIERDGRSGRVISEYYYRDGRLYRDPAEGPDEKTWFDSGDVEYENYSDGRKFWRGMPRLSSSGVDCEIEPRPEFQGPRRAQSGKPISPAKSPTRRRPPEP